MNDDSIMRSFIETVIDENKIPKEKIGDIWCEWFKYESDVSNIETLAQIEEKRDLLYNEPNELDQRRTQFLVDRFKFHNLYPCSPDELKLLGYMDSNNNTNGAHYLNKADQENDEEEEEDENGPTMASPAPVPTPRLASAAYDPIASKGGKHGKSFFRSGGIKSFHQRGGKFGRHHGHHMSHHHHHHHHHHPNSRHHHHHGYQNSSSYSKFFEPLDKDSYPGEELYTYQTYDDIQTPFFQLNKNRVQSFPVPDPNKMYPFKPVKSIFSSLQPLPGCNMLFPSIFGDFLKRLPAPTSFEGPFVNVDEFLRHFQNINLPEDFQSYYETIYSANADASKASSKSATTTLKTTNNESKTSNADGQSNGNSDKKQEEDAMDDSASTDVTMDIYKQRQQKKMSKKN